MVRLSAAKGVRVDLERALSSNSLRGFEEAVIVPSYGYGHVDDYYEQHTCHWRLKVSGKRATWAYAHGAAYGCSETMPSEIHTTRRVLAERLVSGLRSCAVQCAVCTR